jgi:hypothetical protein
MVPDRDRLAATPKKSLSRKPWPASTGYYYQPCCKVVSQWEALALILHDLAGIIRKISAHVPEIPGRHNYRLGQPGSFGWLWRRWTLPWGAARLIGRQVQEDLLLMDGATAACPWSPWPTLLRQPVCCRAGADAAVTAANCDVMFFRTERQTWPVCRRLVPSLFTVHTYRTPLAL